MAVHVGDRGVTESPLYLTGVVRIGGARHTARSDRGPVEPGTAVVVVGDDPSGLVVRPVEPGREAEQLPDHGRPVFASPQERAAAADQRREAAVQRDWAAHRRAGFRVGAVVGALAAAVDAPVVAKLAKIGIIPGKDFDITKLDPAVQKGLAKVSKPAFEKMMAHYKEAGTLENGWTFMTKTGVYGTDYLQRAFITAIGLGANRPQDAIYPISKEDAAGKTYSGANKYVLHFEKGQTPPVNAFWSVTMYDTQMFFVDNPLNKYTVSPRNDLKYNADGSLDLYFQNESPGKDKEANWLPAPKGEFVLMLRMYWPKEKDPSIIDGTWKVPPVKAVR